MRFRSLVWGMVAPAVAVAGLVGAALPAVAASAPAQHCAVDIRTGDQACYSSLADALRLGAGPAASVPLVTFYDGTNKTGDSRTISGPHACTASTTDYDYSYPDLRNIGWNDRVSSVTTASKCDIWFSSDIRYEGECGNRWIDSQMYLSRDNCDNRASSYDLS